MNSIYWHDYETFGVDPRVDRPSQFAGLRTDEDFNVIGDTLVIYCQPPEDYLPNPEACLITGITPQLAREKGLVEAEFIAAIHAELATPGTCGIGYNSLRFDDEVTRYTLYRNFFDPYRREYADGNSRWDLIDIVRLTHALRPEGIEWPRREDGHPSFKLELLTAANGIGHEQAHDALSDVTATIALAKLIKEKQPKLFAYVQSVRPKHKVQQMLDLVEKPMLVHVSARIPAERGCMALMMPICEHPTNKNSIIAYDLSVDPSALLELDAGDIRQRVYTSAADLPEGVHRIPLKGIQVNKSPVLAPVSTVRGAPAERWGLDIATAERHRQAILAAPELEWKIQQVYSNSPFTPFNDPEHRLYDGFLSGFDRKQCQRVVDCPIDELSELQPVFQDERLDEMFFRFKARNYPEAMNEQEVARWRAFRQARLTDEAVSYGLTLDRFMAVTAQLRQSVPKEKLPVVKALMAYGLELSQYSA